MGRLALIASTLTACLWILGCQTADLNQSPSNVNDSQDTHAVDCEGLEKNGSKVCCAAQTPTCLACKDEVSQARKTYDEKCSSHALVKKCDVIEKDKGKFCCQAQTPTCTSCKDKVSEARKSYDDLCTDHALAKKCVSLQQESGKFCCAAQTPTCLTCKENVKEARDAFESQCTN